MCIVIIIMAINMGNIRNETKKEIVAEVKKEAMENNKVQTLAVDTSDNNKYTTMQEVQSLMLNMYPVGSIYISANGTNPEEYIGGVWEKYGEGKTIVGDGIVQDGDFRKVFNLGVTGGEYEHTLTVEEIPSHNHVLNSDDAQFGATGWQNSGNFMRSKQTNYTLGTRTESTGGGKSHNNMQPYIVVSMWKRVS